MRGRWLILVKFSPSSMDGRSQGTPTVDTGCSECLASISGLVKHLPSPPECSLTSGNCLFRNRVGDRLASKPILRDQAHLQIATAIVGASKLVTPASNPGLDSGSYDIHPRAVVSAFLSEWGFFLTQGASRCAADPITLLDHIDYV
jgi:hypothetical protein